MFTVFLMICVLSQLRIQNSYLTNSAIENWIGSASFFHGVRGKITLDRVRDTYDYYGWLDSLLVHEMYRANYTVNRPLPEYHQKSLAQNNLLISPVRLTQRMVRLVENKDNITKHLLPQKWITPNLDLHAYSYFDDELEFNQDLPINGTTLKYQEEGSFYNLGGYVENIDVLNMTQLETSQKITELKHQGFINMQTRHMTLDMMFYNPYTDTYTIAIVQTTFKANSHIDNSKVQFMNIRGDYYNFHQSRNVIRLLCEIIYVCILVLYITIEVNQILKLVYYQFEKTQKEEELEAKKKERQKKKKRVKKQNMMDGQDVYLQDEDEQKNLEIQQAQKVINKSMSLVRFVPNALRQHFQDIWNFLDVIIFTLASITVPMWILIITNHTRIFVNRQNKLVHLDEDQHATINENYSENIVKASQKHEMY